MSALIILLLAVFVLWIVIPTLFMFTAPAEP